MDVISLVIGVAGGAVASVASYWGISTGVRKAKVKSGKLKITSAEEEVKKILDRGTKEAEAKKKDMILEAKEEVLRLRNETERELKERRAEVTRQERRLSQKEENLDRKTENLERKNEQLDAKLKENEAARAKIDEVVSQHVKRLEEISGYTAEQAKQELLARVESETRHEMAQKLDELETQFKDISLTVK